MLDGSTSDYIMSYFNIYSFIMNLHVTVNIPVLVTSHCMKRLNNGRPGNSGRLKSYVILVLREKSYTFRTAFKFFYPVLEKDETMTL